MPHRLFSKSFFCGTIQSLRDVSAIQSAMGGFGVGTECRQERNVRTRTFHTSPSVPQIVYPCKCGVESYPGPYGADCSLNSSLQSSRSDESLCPGNLFARGSDPYQKTLKETHMQGLSMEDVMRSLSA
jgi:hypothetical protein